MKTKDLVVGTEYVFGASGTYRRRTPLSGILLTKDPYTAARRHEYNALLHASLYHGHPTHKEWGEHGALAFAVRISRSERTYDPETQQYGVETVTEWWPMVVQPGQVFNTAENFNASAEEREAEEQAKRAAQQAEFDRQREERRQAQERINARARAVYATLERKGAVPAGISPTSGWHTDGRLLVDLDWLEKVAGQLRTKRAVQAA